MSWIVKYNLRYERLQLLVFHCRHIILLRTVPLKSCNKFVYCRLSGSRRTWKAARPAVQGRSTTHEEPVTTTLSGNGGQRCDKDGKYFLAFEFKYRFYRHFLKNQTKTFCLLFVHLLLLFWSLFLFVVVSVAAAADFCCFVVVH